MTKTIWAKNRSRKDLINSKPEPTKKSGSPTLLETERYKGIGEKNLQKSAIVRTGKRIPHASWSRGGESSKWTREEIK